MCNPMMRSIGIMKYCLLVGSLVAVMSSGCDSGGKQKRSWSRPATPIRYKLPAGDVPLNVRESLHPWIAEFLDLTPAQATERLHERWSTIQRPSLVALRKTLAEFEVRSIVDYQEGGMIYAVRPNADENIVGNSFYLPGPIDPKELKGRLDSVSLAENECVFEFLTYFAGLAEDTTTSGNFVYRETPWPTFTDSWEGKIKGFDEWENALMIYCARNGCHVLVRPNGNVAWWVMQERLVREEWADFDEFVLKFNAHRKISYPFDPYGPD